LAVCLRAAKKTIIKAVFYVDNVDLERIRL